MTYQDIQGWFNFEDLYDAMVEKYAPCPPGCRLNPTDKVFVEVGSWLGKSTAYMADKIKQISWPKEPGAAVKFFACDTFKGSPTEPQMLEFVQAHGGSILAAFTMNMEACGVSGYVHPIVGDSVAAADNFEPGTVDFVFLDGDHTESALSADIAAWLPKVRPGGTIAGHDICTYASVVAAVKTAFGNNWRQQGNCWVHSVIA